MKSVFMFFVGLAWMTLAIVWCPSGEFNFYHVLCLGHMGLGFCIAVGGLWPIRRR